MPMVTPYESRAGIATANAGQAASYRSASAFMTPGQQALPGALNQLARGLDRFGGAVHELLLDRQRMQNATDLLADKVAYEDALREFDSNYRQTRQGVSARTAEEDYNAFHQEQYEKLQRKWGGNPFLMEGVNRMAAGIREPSMSRAVSYRDQQEKQYQQSVLAASRAQTLQLFGDPSVPWDEKMAALEGEENNARLFAGQRREVIDGQEQWTGGNDVTAEVMALRQSLFREHLDGLIAAGNPGAAERLLNTADARRKGEEGGDSVWSCISAKDIADAKVRIQSRIDHIRRESAQQAGLTAQAFGNHLEYGLDKGDFTAAEKDVAALRGLGFTKEAAELSERLEIARTTYSALNDASDLPLVEQAETVHARLDALVTPDNAKATTATRDNVDKAMAQKRAAFVKDPAAYVAALPSMQGEMSFQERAQRSLELQAGMGANLPYEPRVLTAEQAKRLKGVYDALDAPAARVAWLEQFVNECGPYARQALREMDVPEQVVTLLPVLGVMNDRSMGLALSAIEVRDGDIAGLGTDAKQAAADAVAGNRLMQDVLALARTFPANEGMRQFGKSMETMLTNYAKLGGDLADFDKAFESAASGDCFLMLPRHAEYDVDDVVDATRDLREGLRERLLADVPADTQQGRIDRANLTGLIDRGVFVSDETGTKVTFIDPRHGRPVLNGDGTPMSFDIAAIVREREEGLSARLELADALSENDMGDVTELEELP